MTDLSKELQQLLEGAAERLGRDLQNSGTDVRNYIAERMLHLSSIVGQAGYDEALIAERDNVALFVGLEVVDAADAADRELLGLIGGGLAIGARAIAA